MPLQLPPENFWEALAVIGGLIGWLLLLERRLGQRLTRQEHEKICEGQQRQLTDQLKLIRSEILHNREISTQGRGDFVDRLNETRGELIDRINDLSLNVERIQTENDERRSRSGR